MVLFLKKKNAKPAIPLLIIFLVEAIINNTLYHLSQKKKYTISCIILFKVHMKSFLLTIAYVVADLATQSKQLGP